MSEVRSLSANPAHSLDHTIALLIGLSSRRGEKEEDMDEAIINFLRFLSATAYALLQEQVAQGLFQRPWARLIPEERSAVVNQVVAHLGGTFEGPNT